ncbi:hypothetical protein [Agromyces sp. GXS1127]|uniref:hypothetical protein n=1 Tax=Agromyces sp. GXS1127 TaxID=3424181 RepID=UPI003D31FE19
MAQLRRPFRRVARGIGYILNLPRHVQRLEREVSTLRGEIDELRGDGRRVAELYDFVLEEVRPPEGRG